MSLLFIFFLSRTPPTAISTTDRLQILSSGQVLDLGRMDYSVLDGLGDTCSRLVDYIELARQFLLLFLHAFVCLAPPHKALSNFLSRTAGSFELQDFAFLVVDRFVKGWMVLFVEIELGSFHERKHEWIVEIVFFTSLETRNGSDYIFYRESSYSVLAYKSVGPFVESLENNAADVLDTLRTVRLVLQGIIKTA